MKRRALFFVLSGVGGAERMSLNIAKMLPSDTWEVGVAKVTNPNSFQYNRVEDLIPRTMQIATVVYTGRIGFMYSLYKVIKEYRPNVVFASIFAINLRLMLIRNIFSDIKFIIRNDNYIDTLSAVKRSLLKHLYNNADYIIAQTDEMKDEMVRIGLPNRRIRVLQNVLDYDEIRRKSMAPSPFPDSGCCRFVAIGRFSPDKGFDILIRAFAQVVQRIPDARLYILGDYNQNPSYYRELECIVTENRLSESVIFAGYTDNPYKYIKHADVFVLSSRNEGLPNVLVEAMFLGKPVASTRCRPVIDRMVRNGVNGYLAEPGNVGSLAEAMVNASHMDNVESVYQPATKADFISLFN